MECDTVKVCWEIGFRATLVKVRFIVTKGIICKIRFKWILNAQARLA